MDVDGRCWTLLDVVGRCWTLLDVVGHGTSDVERSDIGRWTLSAGRRIWTLRRWTLNGGPVDVGTLDVGRWMLDVGR